MENINVKKSMTESQRNYIERMLTDKRVDEKYRGYVSRALQNGITSSQASKIIDFLKSFIEFKRNFVGIRANGNDIKESLTSSNKSCQQTGGENSSENEIAVEQIK